MRPPLVAFLAIAGLALSGCITTSMQGYADLKPPQHPVQRIATLVSAPGGLASSLGTSFAQEAQRRGLQEEDVLRILPPTRTYSNEEVKNDLAKAGIDAVLIVSVGDSGVMREYAGTFLYGNYNGYSFNGFSSGTMTASVIPTYRYRRQTAFQAKLLDVATGRTLWVGGGQVQAGGLLFIGNGANANSTARAIFDDLQKKGIIGTPAS